MRETGEKDWELLGVGTSPAPVRRQLQCRTCEERSLSTSPRAGLLAARSRGP